IIDSSGFMAFCTDYSKSSKLFNAFSKANIRSSPRHVCRNRNRTFLSIAGTGAIGQEVARLAKEFHMKTYGISRSGKNVDYFDVNYSTDQMMDVIPKADFVISVLPSTKETKYLFTDEHFRQMKDTAIFLNMGR